MQSIVTYIRESYEELTQKVSWLPYQEAQRLTVVVAVFSIIFSLAIWGVDTTFGRVIDLYFDFIK